MKYIGIDGGGTKTKFVLFDKDGNCLKETNLDTVHILQVDKKTAIRILKQGIESLVVNDDIIIVAGLAGYGQEKSARDKIEAICKEAFKGYVYYIYNDVESAITGALNNQDGIVIIAGTGSIVLSSINGIQKRSGGWGYQLGDEGSGYWIVKQMLAIFTQQIDGRLPKSILYDEILKECSLENDYDIIGYVNDILNNDRNKIASLASINYQAALHGDNNAIRIYHNAAYELAKMVKVLIKDFPNECLVSYIGGVFKAGSLILEPLKNELKEYNCRIISPIFPPEYGAFLLGKMNNK